MFVMPPEMKLEMLIECTHESKFVVSKKKGSHFNTAQVGLVIQAI